MAEKPILNLDQLTYVPIGDGKKFEGGLARIGTAIGAKKLGFNVTAVAPGKRAFPFHRHHAIEEMFFILEGSGTLRHGDKEYPVRKGDFMAFPAGPGGAHQIVNTGKSELKFLAVSDLPSPDVVEYPDSAKVGVMVGDFASPQMKLDLRLYVKPSSAVDYFEGE